MSLLTRLRKHWRAGIATIVAGGMLAGGLTAAFAGDAFTGWSSRPGGGGVADWGMDYTWFYQDSMGALNNQTVKDFLSSHGVDVSEAPNDVISEAVEGARRQAESRGGKNPRIVGIGVMVGTHDGKRYFNGRSYWYDMTAQHWIDRWRKSVDGHEYVASSGLKYTTAQRWTSNGQSINDVAENMMHSLPSPGETQLMIIALNEGEPALSYHVDVSTTEHPGNMYLRNNEPVYDTVHTRVTKGQWPAGNRLGATVWLNYEPGHGASAQPTKAVRKNFTISQQGDTNTPQFRPSDFGWKNGWAIGTYWFDITIDKQNNMDVEVNTPDRQQSETFTLTN